MTLTDPASTSAPTRSTRGGLRLTLLWVLAVVALAALAWFSLFVGSRGIGAAQVWDALWHNSSGLDAEAVTGYRVPRAIISILAGSALGVAGLLIQRLMSNPLGDPQILGVNAGAALAIAVAVGLLGLTSVWSYVWFAFLGAVIAMAVVYGLGSAGRGPLTPIRVTMAGIAVTAALTGAVRGIALLNPAAFDRLRVWEVGSVVDRDLGVAQVVGPFILIGVVLAFIVAPAVDVVSMGDEMATVLGVRVERIRVVALVAITVLCGAATAAAGPIGFVGLMVPHAIRLTLGASGRWAVAFAAVLGGLVVLAADVVGRVIVRPDEVPVGIVTAVIGGPVLILLVRRWEGSPA
ncbi:iron chelate uptake ABC transporter family permease subunit [Gordonia sp. TBRC 11910]|uniref:Iron chelate uptake ABC transporter family permease subunit n=1 Tax=Gordonia asplenii TaxID=2725283 RepID=A0A848KSL1_9ACTN|nr:iron chelate uptake ABC transporter family permease subunit [Gordonia asplenii]NMO00987.1 iron chelate uptake ABC transporter family permease subunit [Gordonia asplenii]